MSLWTAWVLKTYVPKSVQPFLHTWRDLFPPVPKPQPWWSDLGMVLVLTLAAICIGGWLLDQLHIGIPQITALERLIFSAAAGFAALAIAASALGVPGMFHRLPLRLLLAAFTATGFWRLRKEASNWRVVRQKVVEGLRREPLACLPLAVAAIFCWFALICTAVPETGFDALMVYLPYPQEFLRRGTFSLVELYRGNIPLYGVVYFALGEVLHNDHLRSETSARMMNYLTFPGLLLATATVARSACRNLSSPVFYTTLAVAWVAACPTLWYHATICYPDLGVALWSTLALQATMRLLEASSRARILAGPWRVGKHAGKDARATVGAWALVAGISAGMAAGIKFSGMYWILLCGAAIPAGYLLFPREDDATFRARLRKGLAITTIFGAAGAAVFLPWLIRNWINTGDPMHPMFQHLLRHPAMDLSDAQSVLAIGLNTERLPLTLRNLAAIPWWMTFGSARFDGTIGPVFLWILPLLVLGWRRDRYWLLLAALLPLFGGLWLIGPQWCRYFLPGIPLAAALGASALANLRFPRIPAAYMAALGLFMIPPNLPGLAQSLAQAAGNIPDRIPYEAAFGLQNQYDYRRRNVPGYEAAQYADTLGLPPSTVVLPILPEDPLPAWHTRYRLVDVWENGHLVCLNGNPCYSIKGTSFLNSLDRAGVTLVTIRHNEPWMMDNGVLRLNDLFLRNHFRLRGYGGGVFFFQRDNAAPSPGQVYVETDLLYNRKFGIGAVPPSSASEPPGPLTVRAHSEDERLSLILNSLTLPAASWKIAPGNRARLSFSLARREWSGWEGGDLTISVNGQVAGVEAVPEKDLMEYWRQVDVDLSQWSVPVTGQPVTLSLAVSAKTPGATVEIAVADPVVYATLGDGAKTSSEADDFRPFDEATRAHPVAVTFLPSVLRAGEAYTMSVSPSGEWAGQWVDMLVACGNHAPVEVPRFRQLDSQGQVRVAVDRGFPPCEMSVRGVRRSGEARWKTAAGSIVVTAPAPR